MNLTPATFLIALVTATQVHAFVMDVNPAGQRQHWNLLTPTPGVSTNVLNPNSKAIRYFLAADAFSTTNTAAELNAVRASFAQWQSVPGTHLKFEDAGLVAPGVAINTSDGTNVVFWYKSGDGLVNGGMDNIGFTLGITYTSYATDNTLIEADIVLNGWDLVGYTWFTDIQATNNGDIFIEGVVQHEIGHLIGLQHSPVGGATMFWSGTLGVNSWAGLSSDEIAAARALYPAAASPIPLGNLNGLVTMNSAPVFGAVVTAEDSAGNVVAGTVSRTNGVYELPALPVGSYQVRVTPLDPPGGYSLITGLNITAGPDAAANSLYENVETNFLPSSNAGVTLNNGTTNTLDFAVTSGTPPLRISHILAGVEKYGTPFQLRPGQSNVVVGVLFPNAPTNGLTLHISGDGLTMGAVTSDAERFGTEGLTVISTTVSVASNAPPGLRTFVIQQAGISVAYANGFLEIAPPVRDDNFDGLEDLFQRRYFPLFTAPQAGPNADPDGDGYNNLAEFIAGTNPTNSASLLKIQSVLQNGSGSTLSWHSVAGKKYQVFSRADLSGATWQTAGSPVTAAGVTASFLDTTATSGSKFYRVQVLP